MAIPFKNDKLNKPHKINLKIDEWYGLNCTDSPMALGEFNSMKNINCNGTNVFPRPQRETITTGIQNPEHIFFCGNKLSYIAGGCLYVMKDNEFINKGNVGTVKSIVNFSNNETLFFPSNSVYNYEKDTVTQITDYLTRQLGTYSQTNRTDYNQIIIKDKYKGSTIIIKGKNDNYIYTPVLKDENNNNILDSKGNVQYGSVTINVSGSASEWISGKDTDTGVGRCRLFIKAWNDKEELLTGTDFKVFNFGSEININGAHKLLVQIGYYYYNSSSSSNLSDCAARRDADLQNNAFKLWLTESNYPAPNSRPYIEYACVDNNRVVGVSKNSFYACSLGNYSDWTDFSDASGNPKETGAYAEELYTDGDFTATVKYKNTVILTKNNMLYECFGNKPPYRINLSSKTGCIDYRSISEINGVLYWLGLDGVYRYCGGTPTNISDKINKMFKSFKGGVSTSDNRNYYICIDDSITKRLMVFDTITGLWCMEDEINIVEMTSYQNQVYALISDGRILKFSSGNEFVDWEVETKSFDFGIVNKKRFKSLTLRIKTVPLANVDIYIKYDNGEYSKIFSYTATGKNVVDLNLKPNNCDSFSLLFKGRGELIIKELYATVFVLNKIHNKNGIITYQEG